MTQTHMPYYFIAWVHRHDGITDDRPMCGYLDDCEMTPALFAGFAKRIKRELKRERSKVLVDWVIFGVKTGQKKCEVCPLGREFPECREAC